MTERDRLLNELKAAADVRDRRRQQLTEAQGRVGDAAAKIRVTPQYKAWVNSKASVKLAERQYRDACDSHDGVELELLTGMTGLPLLDAPKKGAKSEPVQAGVVVE